MFAVAARFTEVDKPTDDGKMWEAGCDYLDNARKILSKGIFRFGPICMFTLVKLKCSTSLDPQLYKLCCFLGTGNLV